MLCDLADACRAVLPHEEVRVLQTLEDVGEHLRLHHDLCEVHRVLGDLPQTTTHLFESGRDTDVVWMVVWTRHNTFTAPARY